MIKVYCSPNINVHDVRHCYRLAQDDLSSVDITGVGKRLPAAFTRSNADHFIDRVNEYEAVADVTRLRRFTDRVHRPVDIMIT